MCYILSFFHYFACSPLPILSREGDPLLILSPTQPQGRKETFLKISTFWASAKAANITIICLLRDGAKLRKFLDLFLRAEHDGMMKSAVIGLRDFEYIQYILFYQYILFENLSEKSNLNSLPLDHWVVYWLAMDQEIVHEIEDQALIGT